MKSKRNIKRICEGVNYISISISEAIKAQEKGINLKQFGNLKSIFIKETDFKKLKEA